MLIIDARELSGRGFENLARAYYLYYKNDCVFHSGKMPANLDSIVQRLSIRRFVKMSLERIKNGEYSCIVECDAEENIGAFMTGYCEDGMATIMHVRVSPIASYIDHHRTLNLYRRFVDAMKRQGANKVIARVDDDDEKLANLISGLGFLPLMDGYIDRLENEEDQKHI
ncbi:MAG TPA: hypothetical protein DCY94_01000 [Firmicutes bacterium]|nr:hypothetical protein [Bacillota bacterium]